MGKILCSMSKTQAFFSVTDKGYSEANPSVYAIDRPCTVVQQKEGWKRPDWSTGPKRTVPALWCPGPAQGVTAALRARDSCPARKCTNRACGRMWPGLRKVGSPSQSARRLTWRTWRRLRARVGSEHWDGWQVFGCSRVPSRGAEGALVSSFLRGYNTAWKTQGNACFACEPLWEKEFNRTPNTTVESMLNACCWSWLGRGGVFSLPQMWSITLLDRHVDILKVVGWSRFPSASFSVRPLSPCITHSSTHAVSPAHTYTSHKLTKPMFYPH